MNTDEHNPTSQPWLPSQPTETAGNGSESDAPPPADSASRPQPDDEPASTVTDDSASGAPGGNAVDDGEPDATGPSVQTPESVPAPAQWPTGTPDPAAEHNGFAPPDQAQFTVPDAEPGATTDGGQFPQPDPGQFQAPAGQFDQQPGGFPPPGSFEQQPGNFQAPGPGQFDPHSGGFQASGPFEQQPGGFPPPGPFEQQPGNFQAPGPHGSGQFPQPDPSQFQAPGPGQFDPRTGGYPAPPAGQFDQASGGFQAPGPGPFEQQPGNLQAPGPHGSGQFPQPDPSQFQAPGPGQFDQPGSYPAPGPGQFDPQWGGFQAPGPFEQQPGSAPEGSVPHGSGQFPIADPNPSPEQHPYAGPGAPGGQFEQAPGGYAPSGAGPVSGAPLDDAPAGSDVYSWAPPPMPTAPPAQHMPPAANNPPSGPAPQQSNWGGAPQQHFPVGQPPPQQQQQGQFQLRYTPEPGQPGSSVNDLNLLKRARKAPRGGWRRAVHKVSRGAINPGESASDVVHRDLVGRVNAPVHGDFRIAILSLKGGVGKTTTTVGLGATFSSLRGDRVIAIDANPDLGTLAHRIPRQTRSTVRNLLEDRNITRYSDVRAHTSQSASRLEVLASEQDPAVSEAFSEADYRRAIGILQSFYNIILTDCGTGLMHSAMSGVLDMASSLVLVTSPAIDGARSASATLDWLEHHGYSHLVRQTVVVVNASRRGSTSVNLDHLRRLFLDRTRAVQVVPFDDHLAEGAEIDLELVSKPTRQALLELAAMVADDFANVDGYPYGNHY